jgi:hypothetical protein
MLRILDSCKAWPTSILRTEGENLDSNKSIRTKFLVLYLERKTIETEEKKGRPVFFCKLCSQKFCEEKGVGPQ